MAWCCGCISLGQISTKLKNLGFSYCLDFKGIVLCYVAALIIDSALTTVGDEETNSYSISRLVLFVVCFQLRRATARILLIRSTCIQDCLCAYFCLPCAITQMVGQLWHNPKVVPGCDFSAEPGHLP